MVEMEMGFLVSGLWWGLFIGALVTFSIYTLARRNCGLQIKGLNFWGGWCAWLYLLFIILAFVFTGWKGGLAVLVCIVPIAVIAIFLVRWLFKVSDSQRGTAIPSSSEDLARFSEQMDDRMDIIVSDIVKQPELVDIMLQYQLVCGNPSVLQEDTLKC
jgi:hypothetical protein